MHRTLPRLVVMIAGLLLFAGAASASLVPLGVVSLDAPSSTAPNSVQIDITNLTGGQALPPDFPETSAITFTISSVTVNFLTGPADVLTSADFSSDGFGGFNGLTSFDISTVDITSIVLQGTLSSPYGAMLNSGGTAGVTISLSAGEAGLQPGDTAVIYGSASSSTTPEPGTLTLLASGLAGLGFLVWRSRS